MYEAFYGLKEKPFNLTPDPRFLYLSEKHKEAFAHLLFGIKNRTGFVMVTGEIGTGKTTICRSLLNELDQDTEVAFVFNPLLSSVELLRAINEEFGNSTQGQTVQELSDDLNRYLLDQAAMGKNCVLVIDEAQDLTPAVLEQTRLLSNLETETQKLLQIVLIGQPELAQHLKKPELRQLNQRITARYHLKPLNQVETLQYVAYRLRVAGGRRKVRLSKAAVRAVYQYSRGTPRVINAICDRALLIGYTVEVREITAPIIKRAYKEIRGENIRRKGATWQAARRFLPSPTILATAVLVILLVKYFAVIPYPGSSREQPRPAPPASRPDLPESPLPSAALSTASASVEQPDRKEALEREAPPMNEPEAGTGAGQPMSFAGRLNELHPGKCRKAALSHVLRAWNLAPLGGYAESDSADALVRFAKENGLGCEILAPSLDQLIAIDLPALASMSTQYGTTWLAVLGTRGEEVLVSGDGDETTWVSKEELAASYAKLALVFWRDPDPNTRLLKTAVTGEDVEKLQAQLRSLSRTSEQASGIYDRETERIVRQIQRETGIIVDGVVGPQVRMVLSSWLPTVPTPSLQGEVVLSDNPLPLAGTPAPPDEGNAGLPGEQVNAGDGQEYPPGLSLATSREQVPVARKEPDADTDVGQGLVLRKALETDSEFDHGAAGALGHPAIMVEDLPDLLIEDRLAPPKTQMTGEVTPPSFGSVPLVPREAPEGVKGDEGR